MTTLISTIHIDEGSIARNNLGEPGAISPMYTTMRFVATDCMPEYAELLVRHPGMLAEYSRRAQGSVNRRRSLSFKAFAEIEIALPPPEAQRRIVDVMEAVDAQIDALAAEAKAARALLRARRSELLVRESATIPVKKAFSVLMGRQRAPQHATGRYMTNYLRSANVGDGVLHLADIKQMNFNPDERAKFGLRMGDVLVSEGSASAAAVGLSAVWRGEIEDPVCFQKTLLRFRAIDGVSTAAFTNHWCQWAFESGTFLDISSGTNIKHITAVRVLEVPVALPGVEEQSAIADELDRLETQHTAVRDELAHLRSFRSVLLASLLSGEIEIPESYDALLEKVS
ncbi:restriction endonuclease subunit S [Mycolicibacterium sp. CR10]|uniref:restriction endonuclease subunit S n=1 Tax=Mycolicibacterium sp. CR10 TaxID=2562314 RepID=UPI0010C09352|nr:restriction endonuclease subunit S [Mycolicibacterium sp. CR10]